MERTLSAKLPALAGQKAKITGWLHKQRQMGGINFLVLRDRAGLAQVVVENPEEIAKLDGLYQGTIVSIEADVVTEPRAALGVELHNPVITVEVPVTDVSPIEIDKRIDHTPDNLDTLFENRIVNMRNPGEQGIFKIQSSIGDALREYLKSQDFVEFHSPKLLAEPTEGGAEVFKLDYFGKTATLAQSAQFYKQIMVGAYERAFEFGATYRAEPSMTTRHMTEFTTVDAEMGFITSFQDLLDLMSSMMNFVMNKVWQEREIELNTLKAIKSVLTEKLPEITLGDLHELIFKETGQDFRSEKDPSPAEERWICEYAAKEWGSEAVFITEFPASHMKFYHFQSETNPEVSERADLIFRGVEIVTGSRREHRYPKLLEQLKAIGGDPNHPGFKYYLQAFQYGLPSHAGFGLGLERLTQKVIGLNNVKEATIFPRDTSRLTP